MQEEKPKELIKGGKSEGMTCQDIADKHGVPVGDIKNQVTKGAKIEHEHTVDNDVAKEIARDHLAEFPYYYDYLEDMEKELKVDYDNKGYGPKQKEEPEDSEIEIEIEKPKQKRLRELFED